MKKYKLFILLILFTHLQLSMASVFKPMLSLGLGIINNSITENDSGVASSSGGPSSAASSNLAFDAVYEFKTYAKKSYFLKAVTPLITSGQNGYFLVGLGINFYFSSLASLFTFEDDGTSIEVGPRMRYYWGPSIGLGYIIYTTETAKKSDVSLDLGAHVGGIYNMNRSWGLRGEFGVSRGTGVNTSSMNMKLFLGANFYFDPFN